ncbi:hypothetical protein BT69DRAFT_1395594 [Atractiella rhizophila]|nr:hypothetical protein BT69DRAFT_1342958 [Atractiella rhizophila]KAH8915136.1 hypothetical protein BT69DRAFT_1395594 [Atractiella rhizophila]
MSTPTYVNDLPGIRRIVTGHNAEGKAIFVGDEAFRAESLNGSTAFGLKILYETEKTPANIDEPFHDPMFNDVADIANKQGTIVRVLDFAPNQRFVLGEGFMHRTESLDYGIIVKGEVACYLDSGEKKTLKTGDLIVQRGTMHEWVNETSEWCRLIAIVVASHPATVGDKVLGREGYESEWVATKGHVKA